MYDRYRWGRRRCRCKGFELCDNMGISTNFKGKGEFEFAVFNTVMTKSVKMMTKSVELTVQIPAQF